MTNTSYNHPKRPPLGTRPAVRQPLVLGSDPVYVTGPKTGQRFVGDDGSIPRPANPSISYVRKGR